MRNAVGRARSGPAPDPGSLRQHAEDWIPLPAGGRDGAAPEWPTSLPRPRDRRWRTLWEAEWRRPQAVAWEQLGWAEQVAGYVACLLRAHGPHSSAADWSVVLRSRDQLGLTEPGMRANHWLLEGEVLVKADEARPTGTEGVPSKERFRVVQGGR